MAFKNIFYQVFICSQLLATVVFSQDDKDFHPPEHENPNKKTAEKEESKWNRVFTGGGLGLSFGSVVYVGILPTIGYRITDDWHLGLNITYIYVNDRLIDFQTHSYGTGLFSRYYFFQYVFAHAEYELISYVPAYILGNSIYIEPRRIVPSFFVGGGFRQKISGNSFWSIVAMWNLIDNLYSPYQNPVIRMGIQIGL